MSIRKFSSRKTPTPNELAEFRHYVSQLKKQGKIPDSLRKGAKAVDARTARPRDLRGGKTLAEIVNAARPNLTPFVSKKKLIPEAPYRLIDMPLEHSDLATVLRELEDDPKKFDYLLEPGDRWVVRIYGTDSLRFYKNLGDWAFRMNDSSQVEQLFSKHGEAKDLLDHVQISRWPARSKNINAYRAQRKVHKRKKQEPRDAKAKKKKNQTKAKAKRKKK